MDTLEIELNSIEPVDAKCTKNEVIVQLADGAMLITPLWWYPSLQAATSKQRNNIELSPFGLHWPDIDEDFSIEGMLKGKKAPNAVRPVEAAE